MHIRLRCPICGMLTFLRNIKKDHKLQAFKYDIGGRGKLTVTETNITGENSIEEFWIGKLYHKLIELGWKPPVKIKVRTKIVNVPVPMHIPQIQSPMYVGGVSYE